MPMSAAALEGIRENGIRWKRKIGLGGQTKIMGDMDEDTPENEVESCALSIANRVRLFADSLPEDDESLATDLHARADDLDAAADEGIGEVRYQMGRLYDCFDFHRICVVS